MITSEKDICNMALDYCNCRNITSMDEETKESKKCSAWYDNVRKALLMNMNATFSIKRATLAETTNYEKVYGYDRAFALPSDLLQVLNLGNPLADEYYQIEGDYFFTNSHEKHISIRYIADVKDVTKYDAEFCDLLALRLAEKICLPLTEDVEKANYIKQLAQQKYNECSTKYGRDNRIVVINKPRYRQSKIYAENYNANYPAQ